MAPARPGALKGCGIKLGQPGEVLYLTEGIETGLSIMLSTGEAVWSCMSAHLLEQVQIPPGVKQVRIMADKDVSQTGERSAWILAERLLFEDSDRWVEVCTPPMDIPPGQKSVDWLDVFNKTNEEAAA
jgi:putative DNA primase/helicase